MKENLRKRVHGERKVGGEREIFIWEKPSSIFLHEGEIKRNQIDTVSVNVGHEYASCCT